MSGMEALEALFAACLEADAKQRERLLDQADPALADEVRQLLTADAGAGVRLEQAVADGAAAVIGDPNNADDNPQVRGRRIGPYELLDVLGHGGMSTVYRAGRVDGGFEQTVAVKLVRHSLASPELEQRLMAERRILARLRHPNIARLLDGGTTEDGAPYFVMDMIQGEPIDAACDRRRFGVAARLRLFLKVCRAVSWAHRNLVVHRDLKPSNVLVTAEGEPMLLDFGIAKLLDGDEHGEATLSLMRLGTPGYASPEQVLGEPVTTASDVYSLGVLLHRLLVGGSPYRTAADAPARDLEAAILEQAPRPPSQAARRMAAEAARARGERPESLARRLDGDLDTIVAMALRKEPERRYGSVEQLAEDIQRHLSGHPVAARPDALRYRAGKFLRRHRWPTMAVAAGLLVTLIYVVTLTHQQQRAEQLRQRAEAVSSMLVSLFEHAGPAAVAGETLSATDLLDRGRAELGRLDGQPQTQALLRDTLASLYEQLGLFDDASALFAEALAQQRALLGERHPAVARSYYHLARATARGGDHVRAEPLFRRALEIRREQLGEHHLQVAVSLNGLALVLHEQGRYEEAEPLYRRAIKLSRLRLGEHDPQTVKTVANLALLELDRGVLGEAETLFLRALESWPELEGATELRAEITDGLARTLAEQGQLDRAEARAREAAALHDRIFDPSHPVRARGRAHLGDILRRRDPKAAEAMIVEALEIRQHRLGLDNAETGESLAILAALRADQGQLETAIDLYRRAVSTYRRALGPEHPTAARPMLALARLLQDAGRCAEARQWFHRSMTLLPEPRRERAVSQRPECG